MSDDYGQYIQLGMQFLGEVGAQGSEAEAQHLLERAYEQFGNIDVPSLKAIVAEEMGPSAMEGLKSDPALAGLQKQSLEEMLRMGRSGGMTLEDKANLNDIRGRQARTMRAGEGRVREQMAARGIRGGGAELAMQLSGNQGAAQRASDEGLRVAADAQKRARDSILEGGRMAGSIRGQDFSEGTARASAADARSRYNTDARMRAKLYNNNLPQQDFDNRIAIARGRSGQLGNLSGFHSNQAAGTRASARGYGQSLANLPNGNSGGSGGGYDVGYSDGLDNEDEYLKRNSTWGP